MHSVHSSLSGCNCASISVNFTLGPSPIPGFHSCSMEQASRQLVTLVTVCLGLFEAHAPTAKLMSFSLLHALATQIQKRILDWTRVKSQSSSILTKVRHSTHRHEAFNAFSRLCNNPDKTAVLGCIRCQAVSLVFPKVQICRLVVLMDI